MQLSITAEFLP